MKILTIYHAVQRAEIICDDYMEFLKSTSMQDTEDGRKSYNKFLERYLRMTEAFERRLKRADDQDLRIAQLEDNFKEAFDLVKDLIVGMPVKQDYTELMNRTYSVWNSYIKNKL